MASASCPDDNQLVEYVEGLLARPEQGSIDEHVDGCDGCRRVLAQFALASRPGWLDARVGRLFTPTR
jgi:hypothetical protein